MSGGEERRTGQLGVVVAAVGAVVLVLVCYVLSVGPAAGYCEHHRGRLCDGLEVFYAPVVWLHEATPLEGPLEWWVELFD